MQEILDKCCGVDVHQETLTACIMIGSGKSMFRQIREFSTMTDGIEHLGQWLREHGIKQIAIESTGIYWKPVFNILAGEFDMMLVNARHVKNVPGRKTDIKDSERLCKLLKNGLLEHNFIPTEEMRNLRDLTRYRCKLIANIASEKNRIIKVIESANIKLATVLTDVFGVCGTKIIEDIASGTTDPKKLIEHISGRVKHSIEDFERALKGRVTSHHIFMIRQSLGHICSLGEIIKELEKEIDSITSKHQRELALIQTIPGVSQISASAIMAETGVDMSQFPSDQHFSSWAGICPGSYESAGKKKALEYCRDLAI